MSLIYNSSNESDTDRFGAALASALPPRAVVALIGTLGAGKTRLVRAVASAAGVEPEQVVSPTFVLVHEYQPRMQHSKDAADTAKWPQGQAVPHPPPNIIYHLDAYRIRDDDEFWQLGPEEYFESSGWTFIEWADRVAACLPPEYLHIEIEITGSEARRFVVTAIGQRFGTTVAGLTTGLES